MVISGKNVATSYLNHWEGWIFLKRCCRKTSYEVFQNPDRFFVSQSEFYLYKRPCLPHSFENFQQQKYLDKYCSVKSSEIEVTKVNFNKKGDRQMIQTWKIR